MFVMGDQVYFKYGEDSPMMGLAGYPDSANEAMPELAQYLAEREAAN